MPYGSLVIEELERVFIDGTPEKRADIFQRVTDLFLTSPTELSRDQAELFDDIIRKLMAHLESRTLSKLSMRLAFSLHFAPQTTVESLAAHADIEVAGPILANSHTLSDETLVTIIKSNSQQHLSKIAERSRLSHDVTNAIVEYGDRYVLNKVAANPGAIFSRFGMSALALRADGDDELIETIAARSDVPPFVFNQLVSYATEKVKARLLATASPDVTTDLNRAIEQVSKRMLSMSSTSKLWLDATRVVSTFSQNTELTREKLLQFACAKKFAETVTILSVLSGIPTEPISKLVCDQYGFGAMVLCKAITLDWFTSYEILTLVPPPQDSRSIELDELEEEFAQLSISSARRILSYWRGRIQVASEP